MSCRERFVCGKSKFSPNVSVNGLGSIPFSCCSVRVSSSCLTQPVGVRSSPGNSVRSSAVIKMSEKLSQFLPSRRSTGQLSYTNASTSIIFPKRLTCKGTTGKLIEWPVIPTIVCFGASTDGCGTSLLQTRNLRSTVYLHSDGLFLYFSRDIAGLSPG